MGCGGSRRAVACEEPRDSQATSPSLNDSQSQTTKPSAEEALSGEEDPLGTETTDVEASNDNAANAALLKEIALKVEGLRTKAQDYHEDLQKKVFEIEKDNAHHFGSHCRENGVALGKFDKASELLAQVNANGALDDHEFLQVELGDSLEIVVREASGWSYCKKRSGESTQDGWVPADQVAEIVQVIADQEAGSEMLAVKAGDLVEVVSRHYSGWVYCREWKLEGSSKVPSATTTRAEGWVTDAFLEDNRSEAAIGTKWHRLVLEALQRVVSCAGDLETVLKEAQKTTFKNSDIMNWMGQCLEFTTWLDTEMRQITQAVAQHDISTASHGCYATIQYDTSPSNANELKVSAGDRVIIENAENAGWIWCSDADDRKRQGWVPRNVLEVDASGERAEGPKQVAFEDLPSWIRVGAACRWHSKSNQRLYDVKIRKVDKEQRCVEIVFNIDESCWKSVPFDHFGEPEDQWRLTQLDEKAKQLLDALPSWVEIGRSCVWWSESRNQCMGVKIQDVDCNRRMVFVFFDVDQKSQKCVPFHQLIDSPESCLLQADKKGHAWRKKKKKKTADGATIDTLYAVCDDPSTNEAKEDVVDDAVKREQDFRQTQGLKMTALMNEMFEDIGEMVGPEGGKDSEGISFADRCKQMSMYPSEEGQEKDKVKSEPDTKRQHESTPMGFGAATFGDMNILEDTSPDVKGTTSQDINDFKNQSATGGAPDRKASLPFPSWPGKAPSRPTSAVRRNVSRPTSAVGKRQTKTTPEGLALAERIAQLAEQAPPIATTETGGPQSLATGGTAIADTIDVQNQDTSKVTPDQANKEVSQPMSTMNSLDPTTPQKIGHGSLLTVGDVTREVDYTNSEQDLMTRLGSGSEEHLGSNGSPRELEMLEQMLQASDPRQNLFPPSPEAVPTELRSGNLNASTSSLKAPASQENQELRALGSEAPLHESTSSPIAPTIAPPETSPLAPPSLRDVAPPSEPPPHDGLSLEALVEGLPGGGRNGSKKSATKEHQVDELAPAVEQSMNSSTTVGNTPSVIDVSPSGLRDLPPVGQSKQALLAEEVKAMHAVEEATLSPTNQEEVRGFLESTVTSEVMDEVLSGKSDFKAPSASKHSASKHQQQARTEAPPQAQNLRQTAVAEEDGFEQIALDDSLLGGDLDDMEPNDDERPTRRREVKEDTPLELALRLLAPDSWDSDSEHTKWKGPEPETLLDTLWPAIDIAFETKANDDMTKITAEFEKEEKRRIAKVDEKQGDLREMFDARAQLAQSKMQTEVAEKFRGKSWEVMDAADEARRLKSHAKKAKVASIRRKMKCRKEVIYRAMGPKHNEILSACYVPDAESLNDLSSADALRDVSDTTWSVLRLVQVVALRPLHNNDVQVAWGGLTGEGITARKSARQDARIFKNSCEAVVSSLTTCLEALHSKLAKEAENTPAPDKEIETVAKGEAALTKEQKRDRALFEGQQEFSIERKMNAKVEHQIKKAQDATKDVLGKVERVLGRRWQRRYKKRRVETLQMLAKLSSAVARAEVSLDDIWREQQARADEAEAELELDRRNVHAQTRLLLIAQMIIRDEKERMNEAYQASNTADKQKKMKKSLKKIRRLHHDIRDMEVIMQLKQNHSVLLYSLRMLEARLNSECRSNDDGSMLQGGSLEELLKHGDQLAEIDNVFEEQLAAEIAKLHSDFDRRGNRRVAEAAQIFVKDIEAEHGAAVLEARDAIDSTLQARTLADYAAATLPMFTMLASELLPEAARHHEVEINPGDASTFRPHHKRFQKAVKQTLGTLESLIGQLKKHPRAIEVLWHDAQWEGALKAAQEQWQGFCEAHPPEEVLPDTPRAEEEILSPTSPLSPSAPDAVHEDFAAQELRKALLVDDLELPAPVEHGNVGLNSKAKPPRLNAKKGGPPSTSPTTNAQSKAKAKAKATGAAAKREEMRAMLGKLDDLEQDMDRAMGKTSKIAKQSTGTQQEAPPVGGPKKGW